MSRKDYVLIAEALKTAQGTVKTQSEAQVFGNAVHEIAKALASDNIRFNRNTFLTACGITIK